MSHFQTFPKDGFTEWYCMECDLTVEMEQGKSTKHNCTESGLITHLWACECGDAFEITPGRTFFHDCPDYCHMANCLHFKEDISGGQFRVKVVNDTAKCVGSIVRFYSGAPKRCDCGKA